MVAAALASCTSITQNHGHRWTEEDFRQIVEGQSRQDDVRAILGSPSTEADFNGNVWYYIAAKKEKVAFFEPEITSQDVAAVEFDADGYVERITTYNTEDRKEIVMVGKTTSTEGKKLGVVEQLLGNLGRFNAPGGRRPGGAVGR